MSTMTPPSDATNVLNNSSRMSFPILNYTRRGLWWGARAEGKRMAAWKSLQPEMPYFGAHLQEAAA
jgi:hypothetical protein